MQNRNLSLGFMAAVMVAVSVLGTATRLAAQQEKVLYSFGNGAAPQTGPYSALTSDAAGNLYGTTIELGAYGVGTVFELTPKAGGSWSEKVLHTFGSGTDGTYPLGGMIFDAAGNLYGTAQLGGANGYGIVFELMPKAGGGWTEKVLHSFASGADGQQPEGTLIFDSAGNLYGTTQYGGAYNVGTVFELRSTAGGSWAEKVLHTFGSGTDGTYPIGGVTFDAAGNLYGTAQFGGANGDGTVFELTPKAGGGWTETTVHSFDNRADGAEPVASVIFDAAGNLYGTTYSGGTYLYGTVFKLTPTGGGGWTETTLHSFPNNNGVDGSNPAYGSLIFDAGGNLYGTASYGGRASPGGGTVFELTPTTGGSWEYTVLHTFRDNGRDGLNPGSGLIFDAAGNLYGTTWEGGAFGSGTVFEITP